MRVDTSAIGTSISDLTLLASPLPLDQCIGLEKGKPSRGDVSVIADDSFDRSKNLPWLSHILRSYAVVM